MTDEPTMREVCVLIREAIEVREEVTEAHTGPRHNELWFKLRNGLEVRLAAQVKEGF